MRRIHISVGRPPDVDGGEAARVEQIGLLPNLGESEGLATVFLLANRTDGQPVLVTTSYQSFAKAAEMFATTPAGLLLSEGAGALLTEEDDGE